MALVHSLLQPPADSNLPVQEKTPQTYGSLTCVKMCFDEGLLFLRTKQHGGKPSSGISRHASRLNLSSGLIDKQGATGIPTSKEQPRCQNLPEPIAVDCRIRSCLFSRIKESIASAPRWSPSAVIQTMTNKDRGEFDPRGMWISMHFT